MKNSILLCALATFNSKARAEDLFGGSTAVNSLDSTTPVVLMEDPSTSDPIWTIITQTFYDYDTGFRWLRVTHDLYLPVAADDIVEFELAFSSDYDPEVNGQTIMVDDSARCIVQQNPDDTRFWTTTVQDYYWVCSELDCSNPDLSTSVWRSGSYSASQDTVNDWHVGVTDDDINNPFCTLMQPVVIADPAAITAAEYEALDEELYYQCSQLKCIHQRRLDSQDYDHDF